LATALASYSLLSFSMASAAPCDQVKAHPDAWVHGKVNALVVAARGSYERDNAQRAYERTVDEIMTQVGRCGLAQDANFRDRYSEFLGYLTTLSFARKSDHEFTLPRLASMSRFLIFF
jgi:hypothetical protein